jgi:hypothetical protein
MRYTYSGRKKQLSGVMNNIAGNKGEYRLFGLQPGTYYVRATDNSSGIMTGRMGVRVGVGDHAPTYFPGVTDSFHAAPLKLAAGSEFRNIDITLLKKQVYSVSGTLPENLSNKVGYSGQLTPTDGRDDGRVFGMGFITDNGKSEFRVTGLTNGSYILSMLRFGEESPTYAQLPIEVAGADVTGLTLNFQSGKQSGGMVEFEGVAPPAKFANVNLTLVPEKPLGFYRGEIKVEADGSFAFKGVPPMMFELQLGRIESAYLKAIKVGDQLQQGTKLNMSEVRGPLTVVLGTDTGTVEGTVQHANGEPAARVRVTAIPYGTNLGRTDLSRFAFTNDEGAYQVKDVAPGEYKVFAWEDVELGAPQDPEFRKPFEKVGVPVKLESRGHATVALNAIVTQDK